MKIFYVSLQSNVVFQLNDQVRTCCYASINLTGYHPPPPPGYPGAFAPKCVHSPGAFAPKCVHSPGAFPQQEMPDQK